MSTLVHICFTLIIYKQFNFCRFRASAYTNVDRLCAVFRYSLSLVLMAVMTEWHTLWLATVCVCVVMLQSPTQLCCCVQCWLTAALLGDVTSPGASLRAGLEWNVQSTIQEGVAVIETNRFKQLLKSHLFRIAFWHFVSAPGQFVSHALQVRTCILYLILWMYKHEKAVSFRELDDLTRGSPGTRWGLRRRPPFEARAVVDAIKGKGAYTWYIASS